MENSESPCWYGVWCKPRQETIAQENLERQGFHVYLPRIQVRKRRGGHWLDIVEALFPRYAFIHVDPRRHSTSTVRSTRGVIDLVRFGVKPAIVPHETIEILMQKQDPASGIYHDQRASFTRGDQVKLVGGPLAGINGIFAENNGEKRVTVLLELLGKINKISIDHDLVIPAV